MTKKIDLDAIESEWDKYQSDGPIDDYLASLNISRLIAELKKMYAREDELLSALLIIRNDLDEGMAQGHLPIESTHGVSARKIRNFANDASQ